MSGRYKNEIVRPGEVTRNMLKAVFKEVLQELIRDAADGKLAVDLDAAIALACGCRDTLGKRISEEKPDRSKNRNESITPLGEKTKGSEAAVKGLRTVMRQEVSRIKTERSKP